MSLINFNECICMLSFQVPCVCENETVMALRNKNHGFIKAIKREETFQTTIEHQ